MSFLSVLCYCFIFNGVNIIALWSTVPILCVSSFYLFSFYSFCWPLYISISHFLSDLWISLFFSIISVSRFVFIPLEQNNNAHNEAVNNSIFFLNLVSLFTISINWGTTSLMIRNRILIQSWNVFWPSRSDLGGNTENIVIGSFNCFRIWLTSFSQPGSWTTSEQSSFNVDFSLRWRSSPLSLSFFSSITEIFGSAPLITPPFGSKW